MTTALLTLTCAQCGATFERYRSNVKPGRATYCSTACRATGVAAGQRGSKRTLTGEKIDLTCSCCGAKFQRYRSTAKSTTGRYFCSAACQRQEGTRVRGGEHRTCRCGQDFYSKPEEDRKFCSRACSNASRRTEYHGTCAECGEATTWDSPVHAKTYCSLKCAAIARSRAASNDRERRNCESCGNVFAVSPKRKDQRYCSRACIESRESVGTVTTPCKVCGELIEHRSSESRLYCSRACTQAATTAAATGSLRADGYRMIYVDGQQIGEHRAVMAECLGRPLLPNENAHHRNGNRSDNRVTNLELWTSNQPKGQRVLDLLEYAREIIALYESDEARLRELDAQAALPGSEA